MLLGAVILLMFGLGGMLTASLRQRGHGLSPLFENSLAVALIGLVLTVLTACFEAVMLLASLFIPLATGLHLP